MVSQTDKIADVLVNSKTCLEIVKICTTPKSVSEIKKDLDTWVKGQTIDLHTLGSFIRTLEKVGAISFDSEKWRATEEAKRVVGKYWI